MRVAVVAREAIERLVDDDWFLREVEKGLSQIESSQTLTSQTLTHEDVGARLKKHLTGKPPCR